MPKQKGFQLQREAGTTDGAGPVHALTRRAWLGGAALIAGAGASCLMATTASAKTAQSVAKYQDKPQGQSKCGTCAQFEAPNGCKLVEGTISENGWCLLYTPKA